MENTVYGVLFISTYTLGHVSTYMQTSAALKYLDVHGFTWKTCTPNHVSSTAVTKRRRGEPAPSKTLHV